MIDIYLYMNTVSYMSLSDFLNTYDASVAEPFQVKVLTKVRLNRAPRRLPLIIVLLGRTLVRVMSSLIV